MNHDPQLGALTTLDEERDAIHIAIIPVEGQEPFHPGQPVGLTEDRKASAKALPHIGIVDPFLKEWTETGDVFWLCLYPRTITSLKHNWTHPAFEKPLVTSIELIQKDPKHIQKEQARKQLKQIALRIGSSPEDVMEVFVEAYDTGSAYGGDDNSADSLTAAKEELAKVCGILLDRDFTNSKKLQAAYFSCGC